MSNNENYSDYQDYFFQTKSIKEDPQFLRNLLDNLNINLKSLEEYVKNIQKLKNVVCNDRLDYLINIQLVGGAINYLYNEYLSKYINNQNIFYFIDDKEIEEFYNHLNKLNGIFENMIFDYIYFKLLDYNFSGDKVIENYKKIIEDNLRIIVNNKEILLSYNNYNNKNGYIIKIQYAYKNLYHLLFTFRLIFSEVALSIDSNQSSNNNLEDNDQEYDKLKYSMLEYNFKIENLYIKNCLFNHYNKEDMKNILNNLYESFDHLSFSLIYLYSRIKEKVTEILNKSDNFMVYRYI
ncbi:hypothetical protein YN1_8010 [Nanoarchaeota archaeon]